MHVVNDGSQVWIGQDVARARQARLGSGYASGPMVASRASLSTGFGHDRKRCTTQLTVVHDGHFNSSSRAFARPFFRALANELAEIGPVPIHANEPVRPFPR
jgi:hypothetical protein